jgi:hypothetical protein
MVKKGLSTHYGTAKVTKESKLGELTTGCGLTGGALVVGIGATRIIGVGGTTIVGLVRTALGRIWCNPRDAFGGDGPTMERREVGCIAPGGDMFETAVSTAFAAATLDNEIVADLLSVAHVRASKES